MGGNVERHIGDDDRDGAAIEAMRDAEPTSDDVSFQDRVDPWMQACFAAEISADKLERGDRLLEEVLELLQSEDYPSERIAALTKYVWSREIGEPAQEPGVMLGTGAMLQAAIMQTFAHPPRTGGRRQMKVLIVGGPNRGQVVDVEVTPASVLELVEVCDRVRGESFWFKVEADVQDKHEYVMRELCRAYEFVTKGETRRQHVGENGKL